MTQAQSFRFLDGPHVRLPPDWAPLLGALRDEGPSRLGDNLFGAVRLVQADHAVIPLLTVQAHPDSSDVCSPITRYARYPRGEAERRVSALLRPGVGLAATAWGGLLASMRIERAVSVNNWLLATNPVPAIPLTRIPALVAWLVDQFPDHAIAFRSVIPTLDPEYAAALAEGGCRLVQSRVVYVIDTSDPGVLRRKNVKADRTLLARTSYRVRRPRGADGVDLDRMVALYRGLYLGRHSRFNAAYTRSYFERLLCCERVRCALFEAPGRGTFDAFAIWHEGQGHLTGAAIGYDLSLPRSLGLYRMSLMYKVLHEAAPRGLRVNLSGGTAAFKQHRGARLAPDYDAVYDRHLPPWRRLPWRLVAWEGWAFSRQALSRSPGGA